MEKINSWLEKEVSEEVKKEIENKGFKSVYISQLENYYISSGYSMSKAKFKAEEDYFAFIEG